MCILQRLEAVTVRGRNGRHRLDCLLKGGSTRSPSHVGSPPRQRPQRPCRKTPSSLPTRVLRHRRHRGQAERCRGHRPHGRSNTRGNLHEVLFLPALPWDCGAQAQGASVRPGHRHRCPAESEVPISGPAHGMPLPDTQTIRPTRPCAMDHTRQEDFAHRWHAVARHTNNSSHTTMRNGSHATGGFRTSPSRSVTRFQRTLGWSGVGWGRRGLGACLAPAFTNPSPCSPSGRSATARRHGSRSLRTTPAAPRPPGTPTAVLRPNAMADGQARSAGPA